MTGSEYASRGIFVFRIGRYLRGIVSIVMCEHFGSAAEAGLQDAGNMNDMLLVLRARGVGCF